jgi:hypothetical protein
VRRLALLGPVLVALVVGLTSCSDKTNGAAVPPTGTTGHESTSAAPTTGTSSSKPTSGSQLAGKDPCSLLPPAGQSQLGISSGEKDTIASARRCRWRLRGPQDTYLFSVLIYDDQGIKDLPSEREITQLPNVGSHQAVQRTESANPGVCAVIMGVTETSRVTTQVTAGTDTQKGCGLAMQLATLVEPELPRG